MMTEYMIRATREQFFDVLMAAYQQFEEWQSDDAKDNRRRVYGNPPLLHAARIYSRLQNAGNTEPVRAEIAEIFGDRTIGDFERSTAEQGKFSFYIGWEATYEEFINGDWFGFESEGVDAWIVEATDADTLTVTATLLVDSLKRQFNKFIGILAAGLQPYLVAEKQPPHTPVENNMEPATQPLPDWANEKWYTSLTIEERQRYDLLRPFKEQWEKGEITDEKLAAHWLKSRDAIRGWRRNFRKKKCPDMDWKKW